EFPGWGYSVVNGATTIWERWDSYTEKEGIKKGMNSFNHYSLGSCTEWMYSYCLGIRPSFEKAGCKKVTFAPFLDTSGRINSANGYYLTDLGKIEVHWKKTGDLCIYEVVCPKEIESEFEFSGMKVLNHSEAQGKYRFELIEE
ncbi:MAG: alpha-L-rhamnosidase, partial [Clostridia bacterium]|nr:alpha-L-rhamnosidase [Clostridia bacterium]